MKWTWRQKSNQVSAKCWDCKIIIVWKRRLKINVRDAMCPKCGEKLFATTHTVKARLPRLFRMPKTHKGTTVAYADCTCIYCRKASLITQKQCQEINKILTS